MTTGIHISRKDALIIALVAAVIIAAAVAVFAAFSRDGGERLTPVETVERLLQVRSRASTDAAEYKAVLANSRDAEALAVDSASWADSETAPIPDWKKPVATSEGTSTAAVFVRWVASPDHPDWVPSSIFMLERIDRVWKVVDSVDSTLTAPPKMSGE